MKTKERTHNSGQDVMVQRWQPHVLDSDSRNNTTSYCLICLGEFVTLTNYSGLVFAYAYWFTRFFNACTSAVGPIMYKMYNYTSTHIYVMVNNITCLRRRAHIITFVMLRKLFM